MERVSAHKTYKAYINGSFARSESGRHFSLKTESGSIQLPLCSRKDIRNAVQGCRSGRTVWSGKTAFNRGQILYRLAEMMENRQLELLHEMTNLGISKENAQEEIHQAIDLCIYYAGWCDKYASVAGTVNPVASSYFNFSTPEPTGIIGVVPSNSSPLLGLVQSFLPILAGGNVAIVLLPQPYTTIGLTLSEMIHVSDFPASTIQLLTGKMEELLPVLSAHEEVDGLSIHEEIDIDLLKHSEQNLKRIKTYTSDSKGLPLILDFQEIKTTWHPIERSTSSKSSY